MKEKEKEKEADKGLSAVLAERTLEMRPVADLKVADDRLRTDAGDLSELAGSLKAVGMLLPLGVDKDGLVRDGARRLEAAKKAGLKEVPVLRLPDGCDGTSQEMILNVLRKNLTPLEQAEAIRRLVDGGMSQVRVGELLGVSAATVSMRLSLARSFADGSLAPEVQDGVRNGKVGFTAAQAAATRAAKRRGEHKELSEKAKAPAKVASKPARCVSLPPGDLPDGMQVRVYQDHQVVSLTVEGRRDISISDAFKAAFKLVPEEKVVAAIRRVRKEM